MKLYKVSDLADMLNVSKITVYFWIKRGLVKAIRIGRTIRIPEQEVERFKKMVEEVEQHEVRN